MHASLKTATAVAFATLGLALSTAAVGATFSDTSLGYRYGTSFAEPFNNQPDGSGTDIKKSIVSLTHVSGYTYGSNFFNADILLSDDKDPGGRGASSGAQEAYVVYRHSVDFGKLTGKSLKLGPARGFGFTLGFDLNAKTDAGYNSKKRMLVLGPTVSFDVPGFLDFGVLFLRESNAPYNTFTNVATPRYTYKNHGALSLVWGIPLGSLPVSFEGFALYIGSKGTNEFGGNTKPETNIDAKLMLDAGLLAGAPKGMFKVGVGYQYWKNKFGNDSDGPAGNGATAKTPMLRAEYHF